MTPGERGLQERLSERLRALRAEFEEGQRMLAELDARRRELHETLVRISGAIQVLSEDPDLAAGEPGSGASPGPDGRPATVDAVPADGA